MPSMRNKHEHTGNEEHESDLTAEVLAGEPGFRVATVSKTTSQVCCLSQNQPKQNQVWMKF